MADTNSIPWSTLLGLLSSDKTFIVKTLDTLFVDPTTSDLQWYFTNKTGSISKKKKDSTSIDNVIDRFSRFSLANPFNSEAFVGVFVDSAVGLRKNMKSDELQLFLKSNIKALNKAGSFLQVYLRPLRGADVIFTCESSRNEDNDQYNHDIIIRHQHQSGSNSADSNNKHEVTESITSQLTSISDFIVECLRSIHGVVVDKLTIECIVDDNQHAWLSGVSQCETLIISNNSEDHEQKQTIDTVATREQVGFGGGHQSSPKKSPKKSSKKALPQDQQLQLSPTKTGKENGNSPSTNPASESNSNKQTHTAPALLTHQENVTENKYTLYQEELNDPEDELLPELNNLNNVTSTSKYGGNENSKLSSKLNSKKETVGGKSGKKKAQVGPNGTAGFRRSLIDEPPSFELMAKFAAERDRYVYMCVLIDILH